jgi:hypothetical protein
VLRGLIKLSEASLEDILGSKKCRKSLENEFKVGLVVEKEDLRI